MVVFHSVYHTMTERSYFLIALYMSLFLRFCHRHTYLSHREKNKERKPCLFDWRSDEKALRGHKKITPSLGPLETAALNLLLLKWLNLDPWPKYWMKIQNYFWSFCFLSSCHVNPLKHSYDSLQVVGFHRMINSLKLKSSMYFAEVPSSGITNRSAPVHPQLSTYLVQWRSH